MSKFAMQSYPEPDDDSMLYNDEDSGYTTMGEIETGNNTYTQGKKRVNAFIDPAKTKIREDKLLAHRESLRQEEENRKRLFQEDVPIEGFSHQEAYDSVCAIKDGTSFCSNMKDFNDFYTLPPPDCDPTAEICEKGVSKVDRNKVYSAFIDYYGDVMFTKVKENNSHSIYMFKMAWQLGNEYRYLVAVIPRELEPVGLTAKMSYLRWDSFQTRSISDNYSLPEGYIKPTKTEAMTGNINMIDQNTKASKYEAETLPIKIMLLHKKNKLDEYAVQGRIHLALETFQTIVTF
jgi:hypothetical protein